MTEQEKQLLLIDLCARLPYHVKVAIDFKGYLEVLPDDENLQYPYRKNLNFILDYKSKTIEDISKEPNILYAYPCTERFEMLRGYTYELDYGVPVEFIKPYLRSMSSMTEEERLYIQRDSWLDAEQILKHSELLIDFCNSRHLDYRGLIPMSLSLEATQDMYNI